jgi:hypothetical protein
MSPFRALRLFAVATAVILAGCAATVTKPTAQTPALAIPPASARLVVLHVTGSETALKSADWEILKGEWRTAMKSATDSRGIAVRFQDTAPAPSAEDGTLVVVRVADYRYVSPGARFGFGVFTGNAFMDAKVEFIDLRDGRRFGERQYNTSSSAWQGIFSAMTDKQLAAMANEIAGEITRR